jgi:glycerol-3-phosphate acyltransferase PlsY
MIRELLVLAAYLLGSVSFSVIVVRLIAGKDIRKEGSGNAGATNVLRAQGARAALLVAALDVAKGSAAVLLMRQVTADPLFLGAAALAVVLGHVFPVFFGFRGGKGVATTVGAFLILTPAATGTALLVFVGIVAATRYVSLGSILAAVALPPLSLYVFGAPDAVALSQAAASIVILAKHVGNLRRLASGTERRLGKK